MIEENSELNISPLDLTSLDGDDQSPYIIGRCIYTSKKGFSQIFLARKGGRLFVLKGIREEYRNDPVALASLQKEFDISFSIDIPGTVRTYDFLTHPKIGKCIALQYYVGSNLLDTINDRSPLSKENVNGIVDSLITTLKRIHAAGIVHRDIKPSNIIYNQENNTATLIDFGCADSYDQLNFKGDAGTKLYKPDSPLPPASADWYALGLTFQQLIPLVSEKGAKNKLNHLCNDLINGRTPDANGNKGNKIITKMLILLLAVFAIVTFIKIYLHYNSKDILIREKESLDEILPASDDSLSMSSSEVMEVSELNPSLTLENDKNHDFPTVDRQSINISIESTHQKTDSTLYNRSEPLTERYNRITGKTAIDLTDPDFILFKKEEDRKAEAQRQEQYTLDWDDLREVNFNDSPDNPNLALLKLIRGAETGIYLDARMEIQRRCYPSNGLTPQQRDSIKFSIIEEKKITDAIKAKIAPKLKTITPAPDQTTIDRLVHKRYLSTFSHLLKKGEFGSY